MAVLEIQGNGESSYVPQEAISSAIQLLEDSLQRVRLFRIVPSLVFFFFFSFFFFFLAVLGFELGLALARQVLYYLSHVPNRFFFTYWEYVVFQEQEYIKQKRKNSCKISLGGT
jgi:hypothetical protein